MLVFDWFRLQSIRAPFERKIQTQFSGLTSLARAYPDRETSKCRKKTKENKTLLDKRLALLIYSVLGFSSLLSKGQTHVVRDPGTLSLENLSCDGSADPLGVDNALPRFHWSLKAPNEQVRAVAQTGYQILVATSQANLNRDHGDVWDSGKTDAALAPAITFAGNRLKSDTVYYWKARVWDKRSRPSPWSRTSKFLTGQLQPSDWRAT